jgi:hypothetical protein
MRDNSRSADVPEPRGAEQDLRAHHDDGYLGVSADGGGRRGRVADGPVEHEPPPGSAWV